MKPGDRFTYLDTRGDHHEWVIVDIVGDLAYIVLARGNGAVFDIPLSSLETRDGVIILRDDSF